MTSGMLPAANRSTAEQVCVQCHTQHHRRAGQGEAQAGAAAAVGLRGLRISLGPELRAVYPVVLNMGLAGDVELSGAAAPGRLRVAGTLHLDGGEARALHALLARSEPCKSSQRDAELSYRVGGSHT
jgi:hypothetical protein